MKSILTLGHLDASPRHSTGIVNRIRRLGLTILGISNHILDNDEAYATCAGMRTPYLQAAIWR